MIALLAVPAIYLTALQGVINVPRDAFRNCLREASARATTQKIGGNSFEGWVRAACTGQLSTLRGAIVGFNVKNGMSRKDAASDADLTVDDYVASSVDHYKFMAEINAPPPAQQAAAPAPAPQPPK